MQGVPKWFWASFTTFCLLFFCRFRVLQRETMSNFGQKIVQRTFKGCHVKTHCLKVVKSSFSFPLFLHLYSCFFCWNFFRCNKFKRLSWTWFFIFFFKVIFEVIFQPSLGCKGGWACPPLHCKWRKATFRYFVLFHYFIYFHCLPHFFTRKKVLCLG